MLCIFILPSLMTVVAGATSFASGLVVSCVIAIAISILSGRCWFGLGGVTLFSAFLFLSCLFFVHFLLIGMYSDLRGQDLYRLATSIIIVSFFSFSALVISSRIKKVSDCSFNSAISFTAIALLINGIAGTLKIDFFNTGLAKPTLAFQEPSHLIICAIPFIIYYYKIMQSKIKRAILISVVLFYGAYVQNLTTILAVLFVMCISSRKTILAAICTLIVVTLLYIIIPDENITYFTSRMNINDVNNISLLVLIQGWENAILTLHIKPFGVGFQQFGIASEIGDATYTLRSIASQDLNVLDGGSTAPKIIGEFGVFGILFIIFYVFYIFSISRKLKRINDDKKLIFMYSCIMATFFDMFVRGAGYFTPTMFMGVVSVMYIAQNSIRNDFKKRAMLSI